MFMLGSGSVWNTSSCKRCSHVSPLCPQPCHVVYTDYRPTPLQHYIFPAGGDGLHLVVDENVRRRTGAAYTHTHTHTEASGLFVDKLL